MHDNDVDHWSRDRDAIEDAAVQVILWGLQGSAKRLMAAFLGYGQILLRDVSRTDRCPLAYWLDAAGSGYAEIGWADPVDTVLPEFIRMFNDPFGSSR